MLNSTMLVESLIGRQLNPSCKEFTVKGLGLAAKALEMLARINPTDETMGRFSDGPLQDALVAFCGEGAPDWESVRQTLCLPPKKLVLAVDYGMKLEELYAAIGCSHIVCTWPDAGVECNKGKLDVTFESRYVARGPRENLNKALAGLAKDQLRVATRRELLAFGAACPYVLRRYSMFTCWASGGDFNNIRVGPARDGIVAMDGTWPANAGLPANMFLLAVSTAKQK